MKKIYAILGIFILIIIVISISMYLHNKKQTELFLESHALLEEGRYEEGLKKCSQLSSIRYYICYIELFNIKIKKNETITEEFCDKFPSSLDMPFWINNKDAYESERKESKEYCLDIIN
jgi:hypothetical protein